jgi:hypothetical protein
MSAPNATQMNPPRSISQSLLAELDVELETTRRLLERVPGDRGAWKPHVKSFSLGHLAQLVARMPGWLTLTMRQTVLDLSAAPGYTLMVPWSLKAGERVFFTLPRLAVMRQNINHLIHHRGQLSVYLRLVDVPLPSIYGPTADEKW